MMHLYMENNPNKTTTKPLLSTKVLVYVIIDGHRGELLESRKLMPECQNAVLGVK